MKTRLLVYDLPIRAFHWLFAAFFMTAFLIGKFAHRDSDLFSIHVFAGLTLAFLILFRVIWGFLGSTYSRFSSFEWHPRKLLSYLAGVFNDSNKRWAGHNPASSWAATLMLSLGIGLSTTGFLITSGQRHDILKLIHEIFANSFILIVIAHIVGILIHTYRHNELIGLSMIHGKKEGIPSDLGISKQYKVYAALVVILTLTYALSLWGRFNKDTGKLDFFGKELSIYRSEEEKTEYNKCLEYDDSINTESKELGDK